MTAPLARIVVLPGDAVTRVVSAAGAQEISAREENRADDLAAALGTALGVRAEVGSGPGAVRDGDVVLCWPDALDALLAGARDAADRVAARCIVVGLPRPRATRMAEERGLAGAVDVSSYLEWLGRGYGRPPVLVGRLDTAAAAGLAPAPPVPAITDGYARLAGGPDDDLVALLARYLPAYAAAHLGA